MKSNTLLSKIRDIQCQIIIESGLYKFKIASLNDQLEKLTKEKEEIQILLGFNQEETSQLKNILSDYLLDFKKKQKPEYIKVICENFAAILNQTFFTENTYPAALLAQLKQALKVINQHKDAEGKILYLPGPPNKKTKNQIVKVIQQFFKEIERHEKKIYRLVKKHSKYENKLRDKEKIIQDKMGVINNQKALFEKAYQEEKQALYQKLNDCFIHVNKESVQANHDLESQRAEIKQKKQRAALRHHKEAIDKFIAERKFKWPCFFRRFDEKEVALSELAQQLNDGHMAQAKVGETINAWKNTKPKGSAETYGQMISKQRNKLFSMLCYPGQKELTKTEKFIQNLEAGQNTHRSPASTAPSKT